jgi:hypothetical protein
MATSVTATATLSNATRLVKRLAEALARGSAAVTAFL